MDTRIDIHLNLHRGSSKDTLDISMLKVIGPNKFEDILIQSNLSVKHALDSIMALLRAILT